MDIKKALQRSIQQSFAQNQKSNSKTFKKSVRQLDNINHLVKKNIVQLSNTKAVRLKSTIPTIQVRLELHREKIKLQY
jgi:hypothetical protein